MKGSEYMRIIAYSQLARFGVRVWGEHQPACSTLTPSLATLAERCKPARRER